jgi:hypothetical protein
MMALHVPVDRAVIARVSEWEIRCHDARGDRHRSVASRRVLYLQLWNPRARVSVVTPSRLTRDRFEIWRDGIRIVVRRWEEVAERLVDLALPDGTKVAALHIWMIVRDELDALRRIPRLVGPSHERCPSHAGSHARPHALREAFQRALDTPLDSERVYCLLATKPV